MMLQEFMGVFSGFDTRTQLALFDLYRQVGADFVLSHSHLALHERACLKNLHGALLQMFFSSAPRTFPSISALKTFYSSAVNPLSCAGAVTNTLQYRGKCMNDLKRRRLHEQAEKEEPDCTKSIKAQQ